MNPDRAGDVVLVVAPRGATDAADRQFLALAAAGVLELDPRSVRIERRCPHCGGRDHGRPLVQAPPGRDPGTLHVSLSRAGGCVAFALTFLGPVGVDIESVAAVSRAGFDTAGFDTLAFGPAELAALAALSGADAAAARARLWTAKEAALKCTGDGLRVDPRDLTVSLPRPGSQGEPRLEGWRGAAFPVAALRFSGVTPGPGLVGTVAVLAGSALAADGPTVRVLPAADIRQHPTGPAGYT